MTGPTASDPVAGHPSVRRPGETGFTIENLPFGVARLPDGSTRCVSALGSSVIDLSQLAGAGLLPVPGLLEGVFEDASLNRFLACGRQVWEGVRRAIARMVRDDHPGAHRAYVAPIEAVALLQPVTVGDFVDFSASIHHATRVGRLLRPELDPLPPQWRRMPVGYHGRAGSMVVSGTGVTRPRGQVPGADGEPVLGPTGALDFEAEVGFVVGAASAPGETVPTGAFADHVAGLVLVNDWSARDVQAYESRPLGPFLGKSFATSVSAWLVTLDALEPYRVAGPAQDPPPAPYLATEAPAAYDLHVEVTLQSEVMRERNMAPVGVSCSAFAAMYWTGPQLLAHGTVNGARIRPGDLFASGTVSGASPGSEACLLEITEAGERPLSLPDGSTRGYLEDGDTVVVRGWAGGDGRPLISLGEVTGTILAARTMEVWMHYRCVGDVPAKRHLRSPGPGGGLLFEELMGEEGFSGQSSLLYHLRSPSALVGAAGVDDGDSAGGLVANEPLLPRHLRTSKLAPGGDPIGGRQLLLGNDDVRIWWVAADRSGALWRNALGDELYYVQAGEGDLESVFGRLAVGAGDYVVVPRSVTSRWVVPEGGRLELLVLEAVGHVRPPSRYLSATGQFLEHAPYCERDIRSPEAPLVVTDDGPVDVLVRHRDGVSRHTLASSPFDVVGWAGCLYPWAFSINDFEPIVGAIHQPPHVHQTFEGPGFVVCSFVPRPYDFHEGAIKVPYHHANVDSDEVIFYSAGDFMSRAGSGIGVGSISLHPAGFVHGPQPGSMEAAADKDRTEEVAVMVDTFRPLRLGPAALVVADDEYPWSWARKE